MRFKTLLLGSIAGLILALAATALSAPASALISISGDWVVSGVETYSNDTIIISANGSAGNLYILAGAELHLDGILLVLPNNRTFDNQGYLELRNSTVRSPNWFFYLRSGADLSDVSLFNVSRNTGGGLTGTVITNASVSLTRVRWEYTVQGFSETDWFIHIRTIMDFTTNYIGRYGQLSYELPTISSDATIEVAYNRFQMGVGGGMGAEDTTAFTIDNALHSGAVTYDIHDNNFTSGTDAIYFGSSSSSTTYLIHDNVFANIGSTCLEIGDGAAADRFGGVLRVWNLSITNSNRGLRVYGAIGAGVTAYADNITILYAGNPFFPPTGIVANEATWVVTNSTISMRSTDIQYRSEQNGHIRIYTTADRALINTQVTQTGASVEHMAFLNVLGATWQNGVAIVGDMVNLREATGNLSFVLDPQNWSAREIVWWGVYFNAPEVDNRDLRPEIQETGRFFACAPSPFLVTEPMAALSIVCTDNLPPAITVAKPPVNWLQNSSTLLANGSGSEYGSGLNTFEWSLNNASWGPVTLGPGPLDWTASVTGLTDGIYTLYLRAVDRTGLATYKAQGPFTIDLTPPTLTIPALVDFSSVYQMNISGTSEPLARVTYVLGSSLPVSTTAAADGSFVFSAVALSEGHNTLWVTAVDAAGNSFGIQRNISVDTVPPSLVVFQSQDILTAESWTAVSGLSEPEPSATVLVNGAPAQRAGDGFSFVLTLTMGLNPVTVTSTDAAGNRASWYGVVVYDGDAPLVTVSINTGNLTADGTPVTRVGAVPITGVVSDPTTSVALLTINGSSYSFDGTGAFLISLPVAEGDTTILVSVTDRAGNVAQRTLHVLRDSIAPTAIASLEQADGELVTMGGAQYTKGDHVLVTVIMSEDGEATVGGVTRSVTAGSNSFNVTLSEGSNTISVSIKDRAGNVGTPRTLGIVRDTTAPEISITTPDEGAAVDESEIQVTGVTEPGASVTVNADRASVSGGSFTTTVKVASGVPTVITVVATDALGNTNSTQVTITRAPTSVVTTGPEGLSGILMLVLGAAAGIAVGFVLRGRAKGRSEVSAAEHAPAEAGQPAEHSSAPSERGPKGPRGPSPGQ